MINEPKLNLACGDTVLEGFKGIDIASDCAGADYVMDLQKYPWDIESESVEEIYCSHYVEHIKHDNVAMDLKEVLDKSNNFDEFKQNISKEEFLNPKDGFIKFFEEVYRILKPGGKITVIAPYYSSMRNDSDPTHVRGISDYTFLYLNKEQREAMHLTHYGINCDFFISLNYIISNEMTLKSEEVRNKAYKHDLNVIDDIMVELIKN